MWLFIWRILSKAIVELLKLVVMVAGYLAFLFGGIWFATTHEKLFFQILYSGMAVVGVLVAIIFIGSLSLIWKDVKLYYQQCVEEQKAGK